MKDMRRWGTTVVAAALILSMSMSLAVGTAVAGRGGVERPIDGGGDEPIGLIDGLGEPEAGGGGISHEYIEPDAIMIQYLKIQMLLWQWLGRGHQVEPVAQRTPIRSLR